MSQAQERKNPQESFLRSEGRLQKGLQECKDFSQLLKNNHKTNKRKVRKMLAFLQNGSATGLEGASIQKTARIGRLLLGVQRSVPGVQRAGEHGLQDGALCLSLLLKSMLAGSLNSSLSDVSSRAWLFMSSRA